MRSEIVLSEDAAAGEEVVVFRLGDECYALPARCVREIQAFDAFTPVPGTPAFVVGLVNVHGRILVAVDLRSLLHQKVAPPQASAFLLRVYNDAVEIGLLADAVIGMERRDVHLAPRLVPAEQHVSWIQGFDSQFNQYIDPALLLADPRLRVNDADS
jgi:purine-binding chemotaxis protein CheW